MIRPLALAAAFAVGLALPHSADAITVNAVAITITPRIAYPAVKSYDEQNGARVHKKSKRALAGGVDIALQPKSWGRHGVVMSALYERVTRPESSSFGVTGFDGDATRKRIDLALQGRSRLDATGAVHLLYGVRYLRLDNKNDLDGVNLQARQGAVLGQLGAQVNAPITADKRDLALAGVSLALGRTHENELEVNGVTEDRGNADVRVIEGHLGYRHTFNNDRYLEVRYNARMTTFENDNLNLTEEEVAHGPELAVGF
ncbi:hypothetical protein [Magnetofaba australis]|uniref:DUF481 domain-containing protein n=1 Tax=Magnetofaba australis IT-1 TaxID=1434232 RepID=A0A1Y2K8E7_9PROT|nr:hypothetical protein [Magnetofaba australis]OSM06952.1 hypothetical protein MAIT1_00158 [Magnetofaba australis IT-1]